MNLFLAKSMIFGGIFQSVWAIGQQESQTSSTGNKKNLCFVYNSISNEVVVVWFNCKKSSQFFETPHEMVQSMSFMASLQYLKSENW